MTTEEKTAEQLAAEKAAAEKLAAAKAECAESGHDWALPLANPFNDKTLSECDATCKNCGAAGRMTIKVV